MIIYNPNGTVLIENVPVTSSAVHIQELMKSDYVKLAWSDTEYVPLPVGSYIIPFPQLNEDGEVVGGTRYSLLTECKPASRDEVEYRYEPEFQHPVMQLGYVPCLFKTKNVSGGDIYETDWTYVGNIGGIVSRIIGIAKEQAGVELTCVLVGNDFPASASCSFGGVDILSAFSEVARAFEVEYTIDWEQKKVYFGKNLALGEDYVVLQEGVNVGVASVSKSNKEVANCYIVRGGTRNITVRTASENNVETDTRLSLEGYKSYGDDSLIDTRKAGSSTPKLTKVLIFDDVYPKLDLYVYGVQTRTRRLLDDNGEPVVASVDEQGNPIYRQYAIYYVKLAYKTADGKWDDYKINDVSKEVVAGKDVMLSFEPNETEGAHSALAGREFKVQYHANAIKILADVANEDSGIDIPGGYYEINFTKEGDLIIPDLNTLAPYGETSPSERCDKAILYNIVMSDDYIKAAQSELEAEALKEIERLHSDLNSYSLSSNKVTYSETLYVARKVQYKAINGYELYTRVQKIETSLEVPTDVKITIGNAEVKGSIQSLKEEVASANNEVSAMQAMNEAANAMTQVIANTQNSLKEAMAKWSGMWQFYDENTIITPFNAISKKDIVALGVGGGDEPAPAGKANFGELLDVIDAGTPSSTTPYWGWNGTNFGWIAADKVTSAAILSALGYTPYDASNPAGYITASALAGYATETFVTSRGYATEGWVVQQGYTNADAVKSIKINAAAASDKLATARTLWGQSFDGTQNISGSLSDVNDIMFKANGGEDNHIIGRSKTGVHLLFNQGSDNFGDMFQLQDGTSSVFMYASTYVNNNRKHTLITRADIQCQDHNVQIVRGRIGINAAPDSNYALKADGNGYFTGDLRGNKFMFHGDSRIWITGGNICFDKDNARDCTWNVMMNDNTTKALTVIPLRTIKGVDTSAVVVYDRLSVGQGIWDGYKFDVDGDTNLRGSLRIGNIVLSNDGNKLLLTHITTGQMAHLCASGDVVAFGADTSEGGGGAGKAYLRELLDVKIDNPNTLDVLAYDGSDNMQKWKNTNLLPVLNARFAPLSHATNTDVHVTAAEKASWLTSSALSGYAKTSDLSQYLLKDNVGIETVDDEYGTPVFVGVTLGDKKEWMLGASVGIALQEELDAEITEFKNSVAATYLTKSDVTLSLSYEDEDEKVVESATLNVKGTSVSLATRDNYNYVLDTLVKDYLTKSGIASTYLTKTDAANTYLGKTATAADSAKLNGKSDSAFVHIAGAETIQGTKTFTNGVKTNNLGFYSNDKVFFDTNGNQHITGGNWYILGNSILDNTLGVTFATQTNKHINVGIHTAAPQYPLDINGSARIGGDVLVGTAGAKIWFDPTIGAIRTNCHIVADGDVVAMGGIGTDNPAVLDTLNVASGIGIGNAAIFAQDNDMYIASGDRMSVYAGATIGLEVEYWGIRTPGLILGDNGSAITDISIKTYNGQEYLYITANGKQYKFKPE